MNEPGPRELAAMESACQRAATWPEPDCPTMIEAAKDTIDRYYLDGRIDAEIRDRLYKILSNPTT